MSWLQGLFVEDNFSMGQRRRDGFRMIQEHYIYLCTLFLLLLHQLHFRSVLLPGESHGRRSLVGCSPWGREESDATEWLSFHFSLSCIGEGNENPLQCSCLENPRDGGAWWAAVSGVAQSRTRLKQLSVGLNRVQRKLFKYKK